MPKFRFPIRFTSISVSPLAQEYCFQSSTIVDYSTLKMYKEFYIHICSYRIECYYKIKYQHSLGALEHILAFDCFDNRVEFSAILQDNIYYFLFVLLFSDSFLKKGLQMSQQGTNSFCQEQNPSIEGSKNILTAWPCLKLYLSPLILLSHK